MALCREPNSGSEWIVRHPEKASARISCAVLISSLDAAPEPLIGVRLSIPEQRRQSCSHFVHYFIGVAPQGFGLTRFPVDTFQVIRQNDWSRCNTGRHRHFE
jgi:hypothetical protein